MPTLCILETIPEQPGPDGDPEISPESIVPLQGAVIDNVDSLAIVPVTAQKQKQADCTKKLLFKETTDEEYAGSDHCHLGKAGQRNLECNMRKWNAFLEARGGVVNENPEIIEMEKLLISFMQGIYDTSDIKSTQGFKNLMTHVNKGVVFKWGYDMWTSTKFTKTRNRFNEVKQMFASRKNRTVGKPISVGYSKKQFNEMFTHRAKQSKETMTTKQHEQLVDMAFSGWQGTRTETKHALVGKHVMVARDPVTACTMANGNQGCGFKLVKNWIVDKTHLVGNPSVEAGVVDTEETLYCQCETHEGCAVKILVEYTEGLKQLKHKCGGQDGEN
jgi:hypothetical protein